MLIATKQDKTSVPSSAYTLKASELNQIVAEMQYIIELAEIVLDPNDTTQLFEALQILFAVFNSTQINDDNGTNIKTQAERNREYEAALAGGVSTAYPEGYIFGGLLTYNTNVIVDIAASKSRSSDNTKNIEVAGASLNITTNANWASGTAPTLTSLTIYIWAVYNSGSPIYLFDNATGSNITGEKRLVAKFKTNASSQIISATLIDFSIDTNSAINRQNPDYYSGVSKSTSGFTADANGLIYIEASGGDNQSAYLVINGESFCVFSIVGAALTNSLSKPISKGDVISITKTASATINKFKFYPCKGNI